MRYYSLLSIYEYVSVVKEMYEITKNYRTQNEFVGQLFFFDIKRDNVLTFMANSTLNSFSSVSNWKIFPVVMTQLMHVNERNRHISEIKYSVEMVYFLFWFLTEIIAIYYCIFEWVGNLFVLGNYLETMNLNTWSNCILTFASNEIIIWPF